MNGKLEFTFAGSSVLLDADSNLLEDDLCTRSLQRLKSIQAISCVRQTFKPATGDNNMIFIHTYTYIDAYTYIIHTYIHNILINIQICIHIYIHTYIHKYKFVYIFTKLNFI